MVYFSGAISGAEEEELQYMLGEQGFFGSLPNSVTVIEHALCTGHHAMITKTWLLEVTVRELQTHVQIVLRM